MRTQVHLFVQSDSVEWRGHSPRRKGRSRVRKVEPRFGRAPTPRGHIWAGFSLGLVAPFGQERDLLATDEPPVPRPAAHRNRGDGCVSRSLSFRYVVRGYFAILRVNVSGKHLLTW